MLHSTAMRGVLAGAFPLVMACVPALAQEALPAIDVAAAPASPPRQGAPSPAEAVRSYTPPRVTTGTKTDTPILKTPASVVVVPQAVLSDQKVTRVEEALENVSGVRPNQSIGSGSGFLLRGFSDSRRVFRNGLLATSPSGFRTEFDAANVERVEVLKGPSAMLFGRIEPGGIVNIVTKRPSETPYHAIEQRIGSYDHYRTLFDFTGPLAQTEAGSVLYRFSGGYENSGSFRDFQHTDRVQLNPSVTVKLGPDTELTVDFEYFTQEYLADYGIPAWGTRPAPIPISRSFSDPNDPKDNIRKFYVGSELTHRFDENWTLRNRFVAGFVHSYDQLLSAISLDSDGVLHRNLFNQTSDAEVYSTNFDLLGHFDLFGTRHETLVGFDLLQTTTTYGTYGEPNKPNKDYDINIFSPWRSYGVSPSIYQDASFRPYIARDHSYFIEEQKGVYFQDHITLLDRFHVFGGGRYDWSTVGRGRGSSYQEAEAVLETRQPTPKRWDDAFSPRVGVLVETLPWLSIYGSWTNSFGANNGVTASYAPQPPQQAEQFEVGAKAALFDERFTATVALYNLRKTNLLTRDLSSSDPSATIAIGEQRSKGVELDALGKLTDSLSAMGSFTYMDARVIKDNTLNSKGQYAYLGHRLQNVPRYSGSLWLKWDVKEIAELDGFSFGFGAYVVGSRQGNLEGDFQLPGYVRFDALAAYRFKVGPTDVTAQLNIRNLTNTRYFESSDPNANVNPRYGIYPGAPFSAIGSIRVEF